ncbi:MAG: hypothetical protein QXV01_03905 [Candidatus Bathyarchaeia archaeon]
MFCFVELTAFLAYVTINSTILSCLIHFKEDNGIYPDSSVDAGGGI